MPRRRKTWREKMEAVKEPKIVDDPKGRGKMLVPTPRLVEALIRKVPRGRVITTDQLRERLARDFGADLTCPLATGWFIRIVAEAAEEELREEGKTIEEVAPYWRVVRPGGRLIDKFPGGAERQAERLRMEGVAVGVRRGRYVVEDLEKYLYEL